jgi:hypothetical protein
MASASSDALAALATGQQVLAEPTGGVHVDSLAYLDTEVSLKAG